MKNVFLILIKIIKINWLYTFIINFRHFGLKGMIKLPIILKYGSKIIAKPSAINFSSQLSFNMLTLNNGNYINIAEGGRLILNGVKACFNYKNSVIISSSGIFEIGNNFGANGPVEFNCRKK